MATIRVCDWTKERLSKDETAYEVTVNGETFEVGEQGKALILAQLEGDDAPGAPQVVERVVEREVPAAPAAPPQPSPTASLIDVEVSGDGLGGGQQSLPHPPTARTQAAEQPAQPAQPQQNVAPEDLLQIPEDPNKPLPAATARQRDRVYQESIVFEEGTLASLNPGRGRKDAVKKLASRETESDREYKKQGRGGVNIGDSHREDQRFYDEE